MPDSARSSTCTSKPRCMAISAASRPIGPAPVTSTRSCTAQARAADALDLLPGLGEHAGRLGEHAQLAEPGIDGDGEVRLERHQLGAVAVPALDAALGVEPVAAHVPLAARAAGAGLGVGPAHDARHQVAGLEARAGRARRARARAARGRARAARGPRARSPCTPSTISRSVPQTPSRSVSTSSSSGPGRGSSIWLSSALPGSPGTTVMACMFRSVPGVDLGSPGSYLTLGEGLPVYSSDGQQLGSVAHVLAEPDKDIFDGVVIDTGRGPPLRRRSSRGIDP